jgi:hypothetical protein
VQLGVSSSLFWDSKAEALGFSGKPRHESVGDVQGFSWTYGLREAQTASVKMKQNSSWRVLLGQILLIASLALAPAIVRGVRAGDGPFHLATDSRGMRFGGHR